MTDRVRGEEGGEGVGGNEETAPIELYFANPDVQRPSALALPFPETPTPTLAPTSERAGSSGGRNNWSRSSADARPYQYSHQTQQQEETLQQQVQQQQQFQPPRPPSEPKSLRSSKSIRSRSSGSSRLRLSALTEAEQLLSGIQLGI